MSSSQSRPYVAITGSSGMIGTALTEALLRDGVRVMRLVRRSPHSADEVRWTPGEDLDPVLLRGVSAVVNLAGAPVADRRWTHRYMDEIRASRLAATTTIATAISRMEHPPRVLLSQSGIGFYGPTGDRAVAEDGPKGTGYFCDVVEDWEAAADPARAAGVRVVHPRTGIVLSSRGGALQRMLPLFRFGLGGRLGSGRQYWSWISLRDDVRALRHLMDSALDGPVNVTAEKAATNAEITRALASALHRPAILPAPGFALRLVIGAFASEVLSSIRVRPDALARDGFTWADPTLAEAITTARSGM